jgi:hypothetical protein
MPHLKDIRIWNPYESNIARLDDGSYDIGEPQEMLWPD